MTSKTIWLSILIASGCSFQGTSQLSKTSKLSLAGLTNLSDSKKISLAGDLMIESLKDDLFAQGFNLAQVKGIVSSAKTEVSLSASLAIESSNLTLAAASNNPYAIATSAVTKGALANRLSTSFESDSLSFGLNGSADVQYKLKKLKAIAGGTMKAIGKLKESMSPSTEELIDATSEVSAQAASSISTSGIPLEMIGAATSIIAKSTLENIAAAGLSESTADVIKSLTKGTMTGISQIFQNSDIAQTAGDVSSSFITAISQVTFHSSIAVKDLIGSVSEGAVASLNEMSHVEVSEMSSIINQIQASSFEAISQNYSGDIAAEMYVAVSAGTVEGLNQVSMMAEESQAMATIYQDTIASTTASISKDLGVDATKYTVSIQKTVADSGSTSAVQVFNDPCAKADKPKACSFNYCNAMTYSTTLGAQSSSLDFYAASVAIGPEFQDQLGSKSCRIPSTLSVCPTSSQMSGGNLAWAYTSDTVPYCTPTFTPAPTNINKERVSFYLNYDPSDSYYFVNNSIYLYITPNGVTQNTQTRVSFLRGCGGASQEVLKKDWDSQMIVQPVLDATDVNQCLKLKISIRNNDGVNDTGSPENGDFYRVYPLYVNDPYDYTYGYINSVNFLSGSAYYGNLDGRFQERILVAGTTLNIEANTSNVNEDVMFEMVSECDNTETLLLSSNMYLSSNPNASSGSTVSWSATIPDVPNNNCPSYLYSYLKDKTSIMRGEKGERARRKQPIFIVNPGKIPPRIIKMVVGEVSTTQMDYPVDILRVGKSVTVTALGYDIENVDTAPVTSNLEYKFEKENRCNGTKTILRNWGSSRSFSFTPTVQDVMVSSASGISTCVFLVGSVRDADGLEYMGQNAGDFSSRISTFVSDLNIPITAPVTLDGFDDASYFLTNENITLDLSAIKAKYPTMTQMKLFSSSTCYYNTSSSNLEFYGMPLSTDYVDITTSYTFKLPSYVYGCMGDNNRSTSLFLALRNGDGIYDITNGRLDLQHDIDVALPGLIRNKSRIELSSYFNTMSTGPQQYDSFGAIYKVGSAMSFQANLMGGGYYGNYNEIQYRFEILHDDCFGNKSSELVSDWSTSSSASNYTLLASSPCSMVMVSARNNDGVNVAGNADKGDGYIITHINTAPSGYTPVSSINFSQMNLVNGFKGQWDTLFAYPGTNFQFYLPAVIINESSQTTAPWVRAVITNTCQQAPYGSPYSMLGAPVPNADSGWVAAGSLISIPVPADLLSSTMGYCFRLVVSARTSASNAFDILGGQGVWSNYLEITPKSAVRPRVDLVFKKNGAPLDPTTVTLDYADPLVLSLTGTDPNPSEVLEYKISIRDICSTYSVFYTSTWTTTSQFSIPTSTIDPASHQSSISYYPYINRCIEVTAFVRDSDSIEYYGTDQGDASILATVAYSDGRLPIVTFTTPQVLLNGSNIMPTALTTGTPFTTNIFGYRDAEGKPLRVQSTALEFCNGNLIETHYIDQYANGYVLTPGADGFSIMNENYLQMALPQPSTCQGSREVHFIQTIKDENPTTDSSAYHQIDVISFTASWN
ncbi:MAG: hypothetical protein WCI18_04580 [Pseudomonadota bacterium]